MDSGSGGVGGGDCEKWRTRVLGEKTDYVTFKGVLSGQLYTQVVNAMC